MKKIAVSEAAWIKNRSYRKQPLATAADLAAPGTLVQVVELGAGQTISDHVHQNTREFYHVLTGSCLLTVNGEQIRLSPGDMLLVEPGDRHRLFNNGQSPFELLVFKTNAAAVDTNWLENGDGA